MAAAFVPWEAVHDETVLEVAWGERTQGWPGALFLNTDALEDGHPTWDLHPPDRLASVFGDLGLTATEPIVVTSVSPIAAARVTWTLRYLGAADVRMVDGRPFEWGEFSTRSPALFEASLRPEMRASLEEVARPGRCVVDVRSRAEYLGETSGYSYLEARGRIPGSIHGSDADDQAGVYVVDGRLAAPDAIRRLWRDAGIDFEREPIFVCGGGWRASLASLFALELGLPAKVYPEGWAGWSRAGMPFLRDCE